jgi:hypothetical protein
MRASPKGNEKRCPQITQITQITQIFLFFLFVFSHLPIFSVSYLPSFRVPSCNFVANFFVIFMGVIIVNPVFFCKEKKTKMTFFTGNKRIGDDKNYQNSKVLPGSSLFL